ncbi:hypothetical protein NW752_002316 [Fusarium irregulare]|uniref:Uncharacterized protein n=1 Tax=Fusarium irregulare TaxID=2494466 RepID=A0A9W8U5E1_9HYPO|nr:hypothetical protein NW766_011033 [Fusarium irregulare]KAJ4024863.1 hypothetical protein NW752_002316 [Fusarium irregulare]
MAVHIQRRLLQAFVRYELRCKIYDPRVWVHLEGTRYEGMVDRLNDRLTLSDCEELHCVFENVRGMYGAVLAQCKDDIWFPDRPEPGITVAKRPRNGEYLEPPSAKELGLLFPDDLYFDGAVFSEARNLDIISCLGLDHLSSIIQSLQFDDETLMAIDPLQQRIEELRLQVLQSKIYRQRGWIFFRDSPGPQPTLPAMEYIAKEHDSVSDWICLEQEKHRRRSQKWQDYWAARSWEDPLDPETSDKESNPMQRRSEPRVSVSSDIPRFFSGRTVW